MTLLSVSAPGPLRTLLNASLIVSGLCETKDSQRLYSSERPDGSRLYSHVKSMYDTSVSS